MKKPVSSENQVDLDLVVETETEPIKVKFCKPGATTFPAHSGFYSTMNLFLSEINIVFIVIVVFS